MITAYSRRHLEDKDGQGHRKSELQGGQSSEPSDEKSWIS